MSARKRVKRSVKKRAKKRRRKAEKPTARFVIHTSLSICLSVNKQSPPAWSKKQSWIERERENEAGRERKGVRAGFRYEKKAWVFNSLQCSRLTGEEGRGCRRLESIHTNAALNSTSLSPLLTRVPL